MLCSVVQKGLFDNAYSILHYILLKKQQMEKLYTIFCLTILIVKIPAQTLSRLNIEFQNTSGIAYKMPLAGGLNCPQFSSVDMNNDGKQDIFVFDRIGNVRMRRHIYHCHWYNPGCALTFGAIVRPVFSLRIPRRRMESIEALPQTPQLELATK